MTYQVYCEECLVDKHADEFDYRFNFPACFDCVEKYQLVPAYEEA